jgi:polygalacturonase
VVAALARALQLTTAERDHPNGDGIDPNGCQDVTIEDCLVSTGDDAVVIKSTKDSKRNVSASPSAVVSSRPTRRPRPGRAVTR